MKLKTPSLIEDWKKHARSYSAISLFANILIALSYGLSLSFGMGIMYLSPFWVVAVMAGVATLGAAGRFIKQFSDDPEQNGES